MNHLLKYFPFDLALVFVLPLLIYLGWRGYRRLRVERRYKSFIGKALSPEDQQILAQSFRPWSQLTETEKAKLQHLIQLFFDDKSFYVAGDIIITREMQVLIAARACTLLMGLDVKEVYPGLRSIYITPSAHIEKDNPVNAQTGLPTFAPRLGEVWKAGPMVLSWNTIKAELAREGKQSLVVHEFTHQLDQEDGHFDGTPSLKNERDYQQWAKVMGREYRRLRKGSRKHRDIDSYGATNEAEFFAVCAEYFFSDPHGMERRHPELFSLFLDFFRIDPRRWL